MISTDYLLLALPLIIVALLLIGVLREWWIESRLRSIGVNIEAEIEGLGNDSRLGIRYYYVEFAYHPPSDDTESHIIHQTINEAHFARLQQGDRLMVCYLPANPLIARLAGNDYDSANRTSLQIRAVLVFGVWIVLLVLVLIR